MDFLEHKHLGARSKRKKNRIKYSCFSAKLSIGAFTLEVKLVKMDNCEFEHPGESKLKETLDFWDYEDFHPGVQKIFS